jgi:hypothetical protein
MSNEIKINSYVILQESSNLTPVRKGPYNTKALMGSMLREIYKLYPNCLAIVVDMPDTSYPEHGYTWLDIYGDRRRTHPRKLTKQSVSVPKTSTETNDNKEVI